MTPKLPTLAYIHRSKWYVTITVLTALTFLLVAIWLPNLALIKNTILSNHTDFHYKIRLIGASLGAFNTNFTLVSRLLTLSVAVALGINVSVTTYYLRNRYANVKANGSLSIIATLIGLLGVGCAACGSVIVTQILGFSSLVFLGFLPLKGTEFSIISLGILVFSINLTLNKIMNPTLCKLKR